MGIDRNKWFFEHVGRHFVTLSCVRIPPGGTDAAPRVRPNIWVHRRHFEHLVLCHRGPRVDNMFFGKLKFDSPNAPDVKNIAGMSGGPIFAINSVGRTILPDTTG
jgi:hypothetical protein